MKWGIEQFKFDNTPLYLESTLEAAAFYKTRGFAAEGMLSLQYVTAESIEMETYEEVVFTFGSRQKSSADMKYVS